MNGIIELNLLQFGLVYLLLVIVLAIMKRNKINQTRLLLVAGLRMTVQLVLAGLILTYIFGNPQPMFTALYLGGIKPGARIYLLGTPGLETEFAAHGFVLTDADPDYVVLGFDMTLTYEKLVTGCDLIRGGVPFIATHPDLNCPTESGYIPDCGAMTALITASTGVLPKVIGKPNREIIDAMFRKKPVERSQVAMVGDRLYTDIVMGHNAGVAAVLVLSGEAKESDIPAAPVQPDLIVAGLGELHQRLREADTLRKNHK